MSYLLLATRIFTSGYIGMALGLRRVILRMIRVIRMRHTIVDKVFVALNGGRHV